MPWNKRRPPQAIVMSGFQEALTSFHSSSRAGLVDELTIHLAPVLLGDGVRLLDHLGADDMALERMEVSDSPLVTHLKYRVVK